jgi:poly-gamma-glutamate synthesis protein (capsule biosynthesis protein)
LRETLHSLKKLEAFGLKAFAGAGFSYDEASEPKRISVRDATVAFSAIGVVGDQAPRQRADLDRPAAADIDSADDLSLILKRLKRSPADYRILSIHQGIEGRSVVEADEARLWRRAVREGELGLIAGHHAHVTRGIEIYNGAVIFYGLGNFLHNGTGDLTQLNVCHSYGLFARVHIRKGADGVWRNRAVEAVPLTDTHRATRRFADIAESEARIYALNFLSQQLDDPASGAVGMRFTPQRDGTGLYCFPGAAGMAIISVPCAPAGNLLPRCPRGSCTGWSGLALLRSRGSTHCGASALDRETRRLTSGSL